MKQFWDDHGSRVMASIAESQSAPTTLANTNSNTARVARYYSPERERERERETKVRVRVSESENESESESESDGESER
jgi:hypothetical protein